MKILRRKRYAILPLLLLSTIAFFVTERVLQPSIISPVPESKSKITDLRIDIFRKKKNPDLLRKKIEKTIGTTWRNYSVVVVDYTSDFQLDINGSIIYTAASVNKLPIMAAVYIASQNGDADLDKIITLQQEDIQDYGTGSMRYDTPGTTYSVKTLVKLMMQKSDNTAAYILANHVVTIDAIQALVDRWGLIQTDVVNNKTSNNDMVKLMDKIYRGNLVNPALTQEMLAFLKDSDMEDRLPAQLPGSTRVYHKTGNGQGQIHDVGIITDGKNTYYLGIFTSDITDEIQTTKLIAKISRVVYEAMR